MAAPARQRRAPQAFRAKREAIGPRAALLGLDLRSASLVGLRRSLDRLRAMSTTLSWPCAALEDADLSLRTTLRVGGRADWLLEPIRPEEFVAAWHAARERGYEPRVLGGGANSIIPDGRLPLVVITTDRMGRVFRPRAGDGPPEQEGEEFDPAWPALEPSQREHDTRLVAWAGAGLPGLARITRDLGWSGFEALVGVPGHLGGGIAMNAGGRWGAVWDVVEAVRVLTAAGEVRDLARAECAPRYRDGGLGGAIVLGAVLRFRVSTAEEVRARMQEYLREKSAAQPVTERSAGCIFKNPDRERSGGRTAGQLIELAGGKGRTRGDAIVSPKHANFIVNRGRARASDVLQLIEELRDLVQEREGIRLETEVKIWG
jgi:UDP-N-acetylmuramate dehydrogenase